MMRIIPVLFLFAFLGYTGSCSLVFADHSTLRNDEFNTNPINSSAQSTSSFPTQLRENLEHEAAQTRGEIQSVYTASGGIHPTAGGLTSAAFATVAYVPERIDQTATAITYAAIANDVCWTIVSADNNGITGWTRVGSTSYYYQCESDTVPNKPSLPANSAWLMGPITITASAIAAVQELGTRIFTTNQTLSVAQIVGLDTVWIVRPGVVLTISGVVIDFRGDLIAPRQHIFTLTGGGEIDFGNGQRIHSVHPIWWNVVADGVTNVTTNFQAMLDARPDVVLTQYGDVYLIAQVTVDHTLRIEGSGTLLQADEVSVGEGIFQLNSNADNSYVELRLDHNNLGTSGFQVKGATGIELNVECKDFLGNANSGGSGACVLLTNAVRTIVRVRGQDMLNGTSPNASVPRLVGVQGISPGSSDTIIYAVGSNISAGVSIAGGITTNTRIINPNFRTLSDNGVYMLGGSDGVYVEGGVFIDTEEPVVAAGGSGLRVTGLTIINPGSSIGLQSVTDAVFDGVRSFFDSSYSTTAPFIRTRASSTTSSNIVIKNCVIENNQPGNLISFTVGTVNKLTIEDNIFISHWTAAASDKFLLRHTLGDRVHIRRNTWILLDDTSALTSADVFNVTLPVALTEKSEFTDNVFLTPDSDAAIRGNSMFQSNLRIRHHGSTQQNIGPYLREIDYQNGTGKIVHSPSSPTLGNWEQGDFVQRTDPSGTQPIFGWINTVAGLPGTWVPLAAIGIGADPGAGCTAGQIFIDTDETDDTNCATANDNSLCLCRTDGVWVALENN